jgi:hypothetical protein
MLLKCRPKCKTQAIIIIQAAESKAFTDTTRIRLSNKIWPIPLCLNKLGARRGMFLIIPTALRPLRFVRVVYQTAEIQSVEMDSRYTLSRAAVERCKNK